MKYLLDTNVISDYARGHPGVTLKLEQFHFADLATSSFTWMEVEQGFLISSRSRERYEKITVGLLTSIHTLYFDEAAARIAAQLRVEMKKNHSKTGSATPASNEDLYIAAIALTYDLTLVTHNTSDFEFFPDLRLADWHDS